MFKYIFSFFVFLNLTLFADEAKVKACIQKIRQLPEAEILMKKIREGGPIGFSIHDHPVINQFGAVWDIDRRLILLSPNNTLSEGEIIGSILFEMHNASVSPDLERLEKLAASGDINKNDYIRAVEYLEYLNSKKCAELAQKGIDRQLFPKSARLPTYPNFDEHFYYQKISGHSAAVGKIYDQIIRSP